jgi:hypothetical protein
VDNTMLHIVIVKVKLAGPKCLWHWI